MSDSPENDPQGVDHWRSLADEIGADIPPEAEKPAEQTASRSPVPSTLPPRSTREKSKPSPPPRPARANHWGQLASELGLSPGDSPAEATAAESEAHDSGRLSREERPARDADRNEAERPDAEGAPFERESLPSLLEAEAALDFPEESYREGTASEQFSSHVSEYDIDDFDVAVSDEEVDEFGAKPRESRTEGEADEERPRRRRRRGRRRGRDRDGTRDDSAARAVDRSDDDDDEPSSESDEPELAEPTETAARGDEEPERGRRRRGRRRSGRRDVPDAAPNVARGDTVERDYDEDAEAEADDESDADESDENAPDMGKKHKFPTWGEAIGVIIDANMAARSRSRDGGRRGRHGN